MNIFGCYSPGVMSDYIADNKSRIFNEINFRMTCPEISSAISKLKRGKAGGLDLILNEMLSKRDA